MPRSRSRYDEEPKSVIAYVNNLSFYYEGVEIDYDRIDGETSSDGYDRSSTIVNTRVTSVDISRVSKVLCDALKEFKYKIEEIDEYCVDRILRLHKAYENDSWTIHVKSGYYGEEIGSVNLTAIEAIAPDLEKCASLKTIKEKIEFVLTLEYGYILDDLKACDYRIEEVNRSGIKMLQDHYYKKVGICDYYKDIKLPVCVVLSEDPKYPKFRLIDGYHRFTSNTKEKIKVIVAEFAGK
jgi:hypothetical protein